MKKPGIIREYENFLQALKPLKHWFMISGKRYCWWKAAFMISQKMKRFYRDTMHAVPRE